MVPTRLAERAGDAGLGVGIARRSRRRQPADPVERVLDPRRAAVPLRPQTLELRLRLTAPLTLQRGHLRMQLRQRLLDRRGTAVQLRRDLRQLLRGNENVGHATWTSSEMCLAGVGSSESGTPAAASNPDPYDFQVPGTRLAL